MFLFEVVFAQERTTRKSGPSHLVRATNKSEGFFYEAVNADPGKTKHVIYVGGIKADASKFQGHLGDVGKKLSNRIVHGYRSETVGLIPDVSEHACLKVAADDGKSCKQTENSTNHLAKEIKNLVLKGVFPDLVGHSEGNYLIRDALSVLLDDKDPRVVKFLRSMKLVMLSSEAPSDSQLIGIPPENIIRIINNWDGVSLSKACYTALNKGETVQTIISCADDSAAFIGSGYWHKLDQYLSNKKTVQKINDALK